MADYWYKNSFIYSVDVETFQDSDGDGVGDFPGLTARLNYLEGLGVNCIWLLPFYPTPGRDNGYDVLDYYRVDERLGTLGHFVEFSREARERGMRVLVDLVVNHTSIEHPWFQQARADPQSKYRDYYVWSHDKPADVDEGVVFPGYQQQTWSYDEKAEAWYFHRFYKYQPDLNISNPEVREEIKRIMGFWLELGVSGFRVDAAPFLIGLPVAEEPDASDQYAYLEEFRQFLSWRRGDAIMLAEANVAPETLGDYFGDGDRMHMLFNFYVNQHLFLALAREKAEPLEHALSHSMKPPSICQWAEFLRNHDELTLDQLSHKEREDTFQAFAPEEYMRLYRRGIRRRLAPMLGGNQQRIQLAYSLLFTLPGTPVLWYGEEIGMGDDLSLPERNSVRTPMQWTKNANGGFSTAPEEKLRRPAIQSGPYGFENLNVTEQRRDPNSLLNWMQHVISIRKQCPEFGWGFCYPLDLGDPRVMAHACEWQGGLVIAVHNLSHEACTVELDLSPYEADHVLDLLGDREYDVPNSRSQEVDLVGHGYRWFRVSNSKDAL